MTSLFGVLLGLIGMVVGLRLVDWITNIVRWAEKRAIYREITPDEVSEERLCKDPHNWMEIKTSDEYGNHGLLNICKACGFMPSRNAMATPAMLERIEHNKKLFAFEQKLEQAFIDGENALLDHFLKQEKVTLENLVEVYNAGKTSSRRFVIFKIAASEQEKRANDTEAQIS